MGDDFASNKKFAPIMTADWKLSQQIVRIGFNEAYYSSPPLSSGGEKTFKQIVFSHRPCSLGHV